MNKKQLNWEVVETGQSIHGYSLKIDTKRVVLQVSGSQDFYPIHHDLEFARSSGLPSIIMNTGFTEACFNRLIWTWIGDEGWLRKFKMQMKRPNILGDTIALKGKVARKYIADGEHFIECDIWIENDRDGVTTTAQATVILPSTNLSYEHSD